MFLRKEHLKEDSKEIVGSLIYYKSPYNFRIRQYNQDFEYFMDQIKSVLESRRLLTKFELVKNMHVIYQNQLHFIYRAQIIDMDSEVESWCILFVYSLKYFVSILHIISCILMYSYFF